MVNAWQRVLFSSLRRGKKAEQAASKWKGTKDRGCILKELYVIFSLLDFRTEPTLPLLTLSQQKTKSGKQTLIAMPTITQPANMVA